MEKSRFSDSQITDALKRVDTGLKVVACAENWASVGRCSPLARQIWQSGSVNDVSDYRSKRSGLSAV